MKEHSPLISDEEIKSNHKCYSDETHEHWFYYPKGVAIAQRDASDAYKDAQWRELLGKAVELIKTWHNGEAVMKLGEEQAEYMWNIYYNHAPEMKEIRRALTKEEG